MAQARWRDVLGVILILSVVIPAGVSGGPVSTKRVTVATTADVATWDPPGGLVTVREHQLMNVYECLFWRNRETMRPEPWLATGVTPSADSRNWRVSLRRNVKFHNGEDFDAEAVKFSIDRILQNPGYAAHSEWNWISDVRIVDAFTVEIVTSVREPFFLSKMTGQSCAIVPPKHVQQVGPQGLARHGIGTGPFKVKEFVRDERVVLEAFDGYWRGRPKLDELVYRPIGAGATRVAEILAGRADLLLGVPEQDVPRVEAAPHLRAVRSLSGWVWQILVKHQPGPGEPAVATSDKRIRQAISHAIDRQALVRVYGGGVPTLTLSNPPAIGANEKLYRKSGYEPQRARALLDESGYLRNPKPITIHVSTGPTKAKELAEAITDMLKAVGFQVNLQALDGRTWQEQIFNPGRNRELLMASRFDRYYHAWWPYGLQIIENSPRVRYNNPELKALARRALTTADEKEAVRLFQVIQERAAEDVFIIPLLQIEWVVGMNRRLNWPYPADDYSYMYNADVRD